MTEVTVSDEENLTAPRLSQKKKEHSLDMTLPLDCVVSTGADETVGMWVAFIICIQLLFSSQLFLFLIMWSQSDWNTFTPFSSSVCERLIGALCSQLLDMENVVSRHLQGTDIPVPQPFHFMLPEPHGLISVVYPANTSDSDLESCRKARFFFSVSWFLSQFFCISDIRCVANYLAICCHL